MVRMLNNKMKMVVFILLFSFTISIVDLPIEPVDPRIEIFFINLFLDHHTLVVHYLEVSSIKNHNLNLDVNWSV